MGGDLGSWDLQYSMRRAAGGPSIHSFIVNGRETTNPVARKRRLPHRRWSGRWPGHQNRVEPQKTVPCSSRPYRDEREGAGPRPIRIGILRARQCLSKVLHKHLRDQVEHILAYCVELQLAYCA